MAVSDTTSVNTGVRPRRIGIQNSLTGDLSVMEVECSVQQLNRWQAGEGVSKVFSHLTHQEHIFLTTGVLPEQEKDEDIVS